MSVVVMPFVPVLLSVFTFMVKKSPSMIKKHFSVLKYHDMKL